MSYTRAVSTSLSPRYVALVVAIVAVMTIPSGAITHAYDERPDSGVSDATTPLQAQEAADRSVGTVRGGGLRSIPGEGIGDSEDIPLKESEEPDAHLPFLFAVFFITWAGFFGYTFVMSRRQRVMQFEIDALKSVLAERERQTLQAESERS